MPELVHSPRLAYAIGLMLLGIALFLLVILLRVLFIPDEADND